MKQASTRMVRFAYEMSEAESGRKLTTGAPPTFSVAATCARSNCQRNT